MRGIMRCVHNKRSKSQREPATREPKSKESKPKESESPVIIVDEDEGEVVSSVLGQAEQQEAEDADAAMVDARVSPQTANVTTSMSQMSISGSEGSKEPVAVEDLTEETAPESTAEHHPNGNEDSTRISSQISPNKLQIIAGILLVWWL